MLHPARLHWETRDVLGPYIVILHVSKLINVDILHMTTGEFVFIVLEGTDTEARICAVSWSPAYGLRR